MGAARSACLVAVAAVSLGACAESADGDGSSFPGTAATEPATSEAADDRDRAADEATAREAVLTLDDFPPGWDEDPPEPESDDDDMSASLAECLGIDEAELDRDNPSANSPTFTSPTGQEVDVRVTLTAAPSEARRTMEIMSDDAAPGCLSDSMQSLIAQNLLAEDVPDGLEVGDPTVDTTSFEGLGDESLTFRVTVPYGYRGAESAVYLDSTFVRVGRAGVTAVFLSDGSPFDTDEAERLVRVVVDRVEEADAG